MAEPKSSADQSTGVRQFEVTQLGSSDRVMLHSILVAVLETRGPVCRIPEYDAQEVWKSGSTPALPSLLFLSVA
jgi:hypothetical protein